MPKEVKPKEKAKFRRVAIEEDSDEEDDEPKIEEVGAGESTQSASRSSSIESKFPLKTAREIEEHSRESKRLMKAGAAAFQRKLEGKEEPTPVKEKKSAPPPEKKPEAPAPKIEEIDTSDLKEVASKKQTRATKTLA